LTESQIRLIGRQYEEFEEGNSTGMQQNKNQERNTLGLEMLGKYFNFDTELIVFIVMGLEECPTTKRLHLQCYAQFGKQI